MLDDRQASLDGARVFDMRRLLAGLLATTAILIIPHAALATGPVTVTVNPPQFDPKDGNYAVFSGSVANAPNPDSDTGCIPFGAEACLAQFVLYPGGVPGSLTVGPSVPWGVQGTPIPSQVSATINLSTAAGVLPGAYRVQLWAYDTSANIWQSGTQSFQWPPDKLTLSNVQLAASPGGGSVVGYQLDHGGTPFRGRASVRGSIFDGSRQLGTFVHKVKAGTHTRLLPDSIDQQLVEGNRYRIRLDARDPLGRKARFRGKRQR
jgi:hypothetical protein